MIPTIDIPTGERGLIRVFALSMDDGAAKDLKRETQNRPDGEAALAHMLGVATLDPSYVEIFPVSDLEGVGVAGYLVEGKGANPGAVANDGQKLGALDGWVAIVTSAALDRQGANMTPEAQITLIGTYPEDGIDWSPEAIESKSAKPYSGISSEVVTPRTKAPRGLVWSMLAIAAVLFIVYFARQGS